MRLPNRLRQFILREVALLTEARRPPDMVIGDSNPPYLKRWYVIPRNKWFNVYFHNFCRSDDDRALHSHPWVWNLSIILLGEYVEQVPLDPKNPAGPRRDIHRRQGSVVLRLSGKSPHRVMLFPNVDWLDQTPFIRGERSCWTLFITGRNVRGWGFYCPKGFVPWQKFTAPNGGAKSGAIGAGCGED